MTVPSREIAHLGYLRSKFGKIFDRARAERSARSEAQGALQPASTRHRRNSQDTAIYAVAGDGRLRSGRHRVSYRADAAGSGQALIATDIFSNALMTILGFYFGS